VEEITLNKKEVIKKFFNAYKHDAGYSDELDERNVEEIKEWFRGDVMLGVISHSTGIPEEEFIDLIPKCF